MDKSKYTDRETLKAVHDNHFEKFLRNINAYNKIIAGQCKCKFCKKPSICLLLHRF